MTSSTAPSSDEFIGKSLDFFPSHDIAARRVNPIVALRSE